MEFYHDLITEKSFKILRQLKGKVKFILIGGWAVFLYTKSLKSKDIDIILDYDQLEKIKNEFNVFKNERLKKYEIKIEEIDIDIYVPYFSNLGLPVEEIQKYSQSIEGFLAPIPELLLILKTYVFANRKGTIKGRKDLVDIFSLIASEKINWQTYENLIKKYKLQNLNQQLKNLVSSTVSVPELNIKEHQMSRLRKRLIVFSHNSHN